MGVSKYERLGFVVKDIEERFRPHCCSVVVIAATQPALLASFLNRACAWDI